MQAIEAERPRIGYIGGGDHLVGHIGRDVPVENDGSTDLYHVRDQSLDRWKRLLVPRNYLRLEPKHNFANFHILANMITDPDQNPVTLNLLERVLRGYRGRLLNPPSAVLRTTRDQVARTLAGIDGLTVPRVARFVGKRAVALNAIEKAGCTFPAILRSIGTHSGRILGIVGSPDEVVRRIDPRQTYFLTQFFPTRCADGLYRKLRVFFIGERQVIRHLLISDHWNVHSPARDLFMADRPELVAEEREVVVGGIAALPERTRQILLRIKARMQLDFFGADLGMRQDGSLILFEANPTMNFFPFSEDAQFVPLEIAGERAAEAFGEMLYPQRLPQEATA